MKISINPAALAPGSPFLVSITFLTVAILFVEQTLQAAEWRLEPVFRVGYEYDDNAALDPDPAPNDEIQGFLFDGRAKFGYVTERTTFDITPRFHSRNYDEERFDSNDAFLKLDFNHQGLKSKFRIRGNYSEESVRTAERADADPEVSDPEEIADDDTGTFLFGDRNRFWILPQWDYDFSERTAVGAQIRYTDVDYDDIVPGTYTPYSDTRFDFSLYRSFSTRTRGYIRAGAGRYERDVQVLGVADEIDSLGVTVGIERRLTETTRFRAEFGTSETEPAGGQSDSDYTWDVNLIRNLETTTFLARARRQVNSSGSGRLTLRDSFDLRMTRKFSERVRGGLGIRGYTTDKLSSDTGVPEERDYAQIRATLSYAVSQVFLVELDYRYTYQDRSTLADNAKSNAVILWLTWQPTPMTASR